MIEEVSVKPEAAESSFSKKLAEWREALLSTRSLCILIFLFTALAMVGYKPLKHPVEGDTAIYDYIAQCILRGQLPYRDIADIKFPGSVYLNAAAMWLFGLFGLKDVFALRIMQIIEFGVFNIFTFLVGIHYLRSRAVGLVAMMIPLMSPFWVKWILTGTQPKLPMMMFGVITLWLLAKDRPFWAGCTGMLACLCWQPGLLFVGTAGLIGSNYLRNWRDLRAVKVVAGATVPLVLLFGYFLLRGGLDDLWAWTMEYNYSVFGPEAQRGISGGWFHLNRVLNRIFQSDMFLVHLSVIGFLVYVGERVWARWKGKEETYTDGQFRDAIIFPVLVYFLFTLVNMQAGPDLIPYIPFIGLFAGYFFVLLGRAVGWLAVRIFRKPELRKAAWVSALAIVLLGAVVVKRSARYRVEGLTMKDQYAILQPYRDMLQEGDRIYVHGTVEMLVLYKLQNLNPYIFLDWGADEFAAYKRGIPFEQIIDEMEAQKPKLVMLTRMNKVRKKELYMKWVSEHYTESGNDTGIFIRND